MVNPNIFREYDIRGIAEEDLVDPVVEQIGRAFGTVMRRQGARNLVLGRDVRLSSERLRNALVRGLVSTGARVIDIGVVPTPVQYFGIVHLEADGGVMITGSHNPIEYNGFKMSKKGVAPVYGEEIQQLKQLILNEDFESGDGSVHSQEMIPDYVAMLKAKLSFPKQLKIIIDPGNGTGGMFAPTVWEELGCQVDCIYCEPDGRFPNHLPDPTIPKYMADLQRKVVADRADIGIGYDGDSDRIGIVDDKGRLVYADRLLALFSIDVLQKHPGATIVFDVKCSQALPEVIEEHGGRPLMWKTGHSLLKAKMKEVHAPLAGEMSGHMFFADDFFGFDDAIYSSGRLMQILARGDRSLSELVDALPYYESTPEIRVDCTDEDKFNVVADLAKEFRSEYETIEVDGARVLFGDGWGLVRASNTQPVLVLRFEARTKERLGEIIELFKAKLRKYPSVRFRDEEFQV